jgi:hypothetical protein
MEKDKKQSTCSINSTISEVAAALKTMPIEHKIPERAIAGMKSLAKSNKKYLQKSLD